MDVAVTPTGSVRSMRSNVEKRDFMKLCWNAAEIPGLFRGCTIATHCAPRPYAGALMRGAVRITFLIMIERLSHFGHASLANFCCAAKNLHLPAKKSRQVESFTGSQRRNIARSSKYLSQLGFSAIQIDYSARKTVQTDVFSIDPQMTFLSFLLRCHIPFPKSALGYVCELCSV
ncbi:hypothetical protein [Rhizobium sp. NPDC090279]|uniref:hypothetical protein n=1 Tax=Rhizobium sp. NPDC090279 TaxID=3364499 RepID=UPI00383A7A44